MYKEFPVNNYNEIFSKIEKLKIRKIIPENKKYTSIKKPQKKSFRARGEFLEFENAYYAIRLMKCTLFKNKGSSSGNIFC